MRIEKISKNTVNVYISHNDLAARHLSFASLKEDSADYTKLVWDAIDHANIEFGREIDDRQLRVVNRFDNDGCLVLTISHSIDEDAHEGALYDEENPLLEHFDKILNAEKIKYKIIGNGSNLLFSDNLYDGVLPSIDDVLNSNNKTRKTSQDTNAEQNPNGTAFRNIFQKINAETDARKNFRYNTGKKSEPAQEENYDDIAENKSAEGIPESNDNREHAEERKNHLLPDWDIIVFPVFTDMVEFFSKNQNFKRIASSLYGYRGAYYLLLKPNSKNQHTVERLEALVVDYNATYLPAESFLPLLLERGKVIMESGAISKIIKHFTL